MHAPPALLFSNVASGVRSIQYIFERTRALIHFDQPNADTYIENTVLPGKAIACYSSTNIISNLPRLIERATHQEESKFVTAEAPNDIRITHLIAQQRGDFAQHIIASHMAAGIVNCFEAIQIHVAKYMLAIVLLGRLQPDIYLPLKLPPVNKTRQRIMGCLVTHLTSHAPQFAHISHDHDCTGDIAIRLGNR